MAESTSDRRTCSKCGVSKALDEFAKAAWCTEGRRGVCKQCRRYQTGSDLPTAKKHAAVSHSASLSRHVTGTRTKGPEP